jgi:hypothetical protein
MEEPQPLLQAWPLPAPVIFLVGTGGFSVVAAEEIVLSSIIIFCIICWCIQL